MVCAAAQLQSDTAIRSGSPHNALHAFGLVIMIAMCRTNPSPMMHGLERKKEDLQVFRDVVEPNSLHTCYVGLWLRVKSLYTLQKLCKGHIVTRCTRAWSKNLPCML